MWFRYKHKWASGHDSSWTYIEWDDNHYKQTKSGEHDFIRDNDLCSEYDYSDKYRGINYDLIESPPKEWLLKKIKNLTAGLGRTKKYIDRLQELYDKVQ